MGYHTTFTGHVTVEPPLNGPEMAFLRRFNRDDHRTMLGAPGAYCQWVPTEDGTGLQWDGGEKFYDSEDWMRFLIDNFLTDAGRTSGGEEFRHFTFNHTVNGRIEAQGEDPDDKWALLVTDNAVSVLKYATILELARTDETMAAALATLKAAGVTPEQYARATGQEI